MVGAFLVTAVNAQPKIGKMAPELSIVSASDQTISLASLRGQVVLVDFWASWCMPCRKSNRSLAPIYSRYHQKGFEIMGISLDHDTSAWRKAIAVDRIKWMQLNDKRGWNTPAAAAWGIEFLPTSFLIDKQGRIISIDPGAEELRKYLQQALN